MSVHQPLRSRILLNCSFPAYDILKRWASIELSTMHMREAQLGVVSSGYGRGVSPGWAPIQLSEPPSRLPKDQKSASEKVRGKNIQMQALSTLIKTLFVKISERHAATCQGLLAFDCWLEDHRTTSLKRRNSRCRSCRWNSYYIGSERQRILH
jgi:hypothetical protein